MLPTTWWLKSQVVKVLGIFAWWYLYQKLTPYPTSVYLMKFFSKYSAYNHNLTLHRGITSSKYFHTAYDPLDVGILRNSISFSTDFIMHILRRQEWCQTSSEHWFVSCCFWYCIFCIDYSFVSDEIFELTYFIMLSEISLNSF